MSDVVRLEHLCVRDSKGVLINDISLVIHERESVGIIGESGSGKTMTIKALLGILPPDVSMSREKLEIDGIDMSRLSRSEKRRLRGTRIGFVPQNTVDYLHPYLRISEQMIDGYMTYEKTSRAKALEKARMLLASTGIDDVERVMRSYPAELSGGMRQRVNIAMAMMCSARLIIADEPTSALDSIVRRQVARLYFDLGGRSEFSILLVSHDLEFMRTYCDRIIVMYAGSIVEEGPTEDIFSSPLHPYTKALLSLVPDFCYDRAKKLPELPGFVPDEGRDRPGCIFYDRCPHRMDECVNSVSRICMDGRSVLCNLYREESHADS